MQWYSGESALISCAVFVVSVYMTFLQLDLSVSHLGRAATCKEIGIVCELASTLPDGNAQRVTFLHVGGFFDKFMQERVRGGLVGASAITSLAEAFPNLTILLVQCYIFSMADINNTPAHVFSQPLRQFNRH